MTTVGWVVVAVLACAPVVFAWAAVEWLARRPHGYEPTAAGPPPTVPPPKRDDARDAMGRRYW